MVAGSIGTLIEQFDFNIYGIFAVFFSKQFFPTSNSLDALLDTFLVFALGFFFRPVGGALLGSYVDRHGRRAGLVLTMVMMTVGSLVIGLAPSYAAIGVLAPVLLVLARALQGLAAGGEVGAAMPFLAEMSSRRRRGLGTSPQNIATGLSLLGVSGLALILVTVLSDAQMRSWGWRVSFLVAACLGVIAIIIRSRVSETPEFEARRETARTSRPLSQLTRHQWRQVLLVVGIMVAPLTQFYVWLIYLPTFARTFTHLPSSSTLPWSTVSLAMFTVTVPVSAWLSDRYGRRPLLIAFAVGGLVLVPISIATLTSTTSLGAYALLQCLGAVLVGISSGVVTALVTEQFGTSVRGSGVGLAYSLSAAAFGGTAPYIATWLTGGGHTQSLTIYLVAGLVVSLVVYLKMPETRGIDLAAIGQSQQTKVQGTDKGAQSTDKERTML
jgi:MHS family alpha-ketoglutarate permease-like MFS transporter